MKHPPNELCECHDCHVARRTTVLPYMGKPKEPERNHRKSQEAIGDGILRKRPMIRESEE